MIIDTNALSEFAANNQNVINQLPRDRPFYLSVIVIGEFRFGLQGSNQQSILEPWLNQLIASVNVLTVDLETTQHYAVIRHQLKLANLKIPPNDSWIAALATQYNEPVLSQDKHFDKIPGVTRIGW